MKKFKESSYKYSLVQGYKFLLTILPHSYLKNLFDPFVSKDNPISLVISNVQGPRKSPLKFNDGSYSISLAGGFTHATEGIYVSSHLDTIKVVSYGD